MKIVQVTVDWMENWANDPRFEVTLDSKNVWPLRTEAVWRKFGGIHLTVTGDDVAHYFYSDGKPTQGFGGAEFSGTLVDGTPFVYSGAWSSRASVVNRAVAGEDWLRVVDCTLLHGSDCPGSGAVWASELVAYWRGIRSFVPWGLAWVDVGDHAPILLPTRADGSLKNYSQDQIVERVR